MYKTTSKNKHHVSSYDIRKDIEKIKNAFSDTAKDVKKQAGNLVWNSTDNIKKRIKGKTKTMQKNVGRYVNKKPLQSLGIAALSGLVLGYIIRRRIQKKFKHNSHL